MDPDIRLVVPANGGVGYDILAEVRGGDRLADLAFDFTEVSLINPAAGVRVSDEEAERNVLILTIT